MKIKEYKLSRIKNKIVKDNNLIESKGSHNGDCVFDFSYLNELDLKDYEKETIKKHALENVSCAITEDFYGGYDAFVSYSGISHFIPHKIYSNKTGKRICVIIQLDKLKHYHGERDNLYDQYLKGEEKIYKSGFAEPLSYYEI